MMKRTRGAKSPMNSLRHLSMIAMVLLVAAVLIAPVAATGTNESAISGIEYATLQYAVDNATADDTVTLLKDIQLGTTVTIAEGKTLTLDLAGYNITNATTGLSAIQNNGSLTLTDSVGGGNITARIGVNNYGTLVMNGGIIIACEQGGAAVYNNADCKANFTMNGGELKVTFVGSYADSTGGACLRNTGDAEALITGGILNSVSARTYAIISNGKLEITPGEGKEVKMTAYRGIAIDAGTAVINGGTFTVLDANEEEDRYVAYETYYALYVGGNDSNVTVNGGTFTAPDSSVWRPDWDEEATDLIINGGTFNGSLIGNAGYYPSKYIVVKGGIFTADPTEYLADGYIAKINAESKWEVAEDLKTITWKNGDVTLAITTVKNGTTPEYPTDNPEPTKPADAQYTYTFTGWSPALGNVTEDTTYTALFSSTPVSVAQDSSSGSSSSGSSVWLTETPTQTPTPTETTQPTDTVPTNISVIQPTETPETPGFGVLAVIVVLIVLAGLGVVAVLRRR